MRNIETKPVIGIPAMHSKNDWGRVVDAANNSYIQALIEAGAAPLLIPSTADEAAIYSIYRRIDGLMLMGGDDIDPKFYGEAMNGSEEIDLLRDDTELMITRWALEDDLPILGICRGVQLLNVAAGGSLYQDIASQLPESTLDHRESFKRRQREYIAHPVKLEADSRLAQILGTSEIGVNTLHHQSVKAPGKDLRVVGVAPDGVVEAIESEKHGWVLGLQCHPENLWQQHGWAKKLFAEFVAEVTRRATVGSRG